MFHFYLLKQENFISYTFDDDLPVCFPITALPFYKNIPAPEAKFIVPEQGDICSWLRHKGYRAGLPAYVAWRAGTTILSGVNFISQVRDYEFGTRQHSKVVHLLQ